jgi:hypothetical protein
MEYLSEEHYKIAEGNGISRSTAYARVYVYKKPWPIERAITEPPKKPDPEMEKWVAIAKKNRVPIKTFKDRVAHGWSYKRAATERRKNRKQVAKASHNRRKDRVFTTRQLNTMKKNGIPYTTAIGRHRRGWTKKDAITKPIDTRFRKEKSS